MHVTVRRYLPSMVLLFVAAGALAGVLVLRATDRREYLYRFKASARVESPLKAIAFFESRLEAGGRGPLDLAELSGLYLAQGRISSDPAWFDRAERAAAESLTLLPTSNPARLVQARIADARHRFDEAVALASQSLAERPEPAALSQLAASHLAAGRLALALRFADEARRVRPTFEAYLLRARVLAAEGRMAEAESDLRHAVVVEDLGSPGESAQLRAFWGEMLTRDGRHAKAARLLDESLRILPGNAQALGLKGELELRQGRYEAAEALFLEAFQASRQARDLVRYARARAAGHGQPAAVQLREQAEKILRRELERDLGHRLDLVHLLLDRARPEDLQEAVRLTAAEILVRQGPEAILLRCRALVATGELEGALRELKTALAKERLGPELLGLKADIEASLGNPDRVARGQAIPDRG